MISWHRFYDPSIGRYITADPIGLAGGMNLYAYVGGNPINAVDPRGLEITVCLYPNAAASQGHVGLGLPEYWWGTSGFYGEDGKFIDDGVVKPDIYHESECITIETTCEQEECIRRCLNQRESQPGSYNLLTRQCTDFARSCLQRCGLPSGANNPIQPKTWFRTLVWNIQ